MLTEAINRQPEYEMLGLKSYEKALPVNPVVRKLSFGRYLTLVNIAVAPSGAISGGTRKTVLPPHFINVFLAKRGRKVFPSHSLFPELEPVALTRAQHGAVVTVAAAIGRGSSGGCVNRGAGSSTAGEP